MNRIGKALAATFVLLASTLLLAPLAYACCIPCQNFCNQPGVPPTAQCCTGIPVPGNACGLTTCGKWLQGPRSETASVFDSAALVTPAQAPAPSCEQVFPWLAAAE